MIFFLILKHKKSIIKFIQKKKEYDKKENNCVYDRINHYCRRICRQSIVTTV